MNRKQIIPLFCGLLGCLPKSAFQLGFTNGLMSESMFIWFVIMIVWLMKGKSQNA